jgi:hypothetical protein
MSNIRFSDVLGREALRPIEASAAVSLSAGTGSIGVLNVTGERGVLKSVSFRITTAVTGSPVVSITVTIDGSTAMTITIYNGSNTMTTEASPHIKHPGGTGSSTSALNLAWGMDLDLPYNTSANVTVVVGTVASAGDIDTCVIRKVPL